MTQDELWDQKWLQYMQFMHDNHRCPSKYAPEERNMINWAKHNRKVRNKGLMKPSRISKFKQLTDEAMKLHRTNQYG